jgi:hypothetical protein
LLRDRPESGVLATLCAWIASEIRNYARKPWP